MVFVMVEILTGPCEEAFIEECELLRSDLLQYDLDVEGQHASEQMMKEDFGWSEFLFRD